MTDDLENKSNVLPFRKRQQGPPPETNLLHSSQDPSEAITIHVREVTEALAPVIDIHTGRRVPQPPRTVHGRK